MKELDFEKKVLLDLLEKRFINNMHRHKNVVWSDVLTAINKNDKALSVLFQMEETSGEPDVVCLEKNAKEIIFYDCSSESPKGRRSLCYDNEALLSRKKFPPKNSAVNMAKEMGITLLDELMYRALQVMEPFDLKTSSWVATPKEIRKNGGAIFCDNRYEHVFTYHNGADSYYGSRGFRGYFKVI